MIVNTDYILLLVTGQLSLTSDHNTDSNILDLAAKIIPHQDNAVLCNEVNEKVVQHFVHCIESHGKHVQYLRFLQTIVHTESQFIRRCQDLVMQVCAGLK